MKLRFLGVFLIAILPLDAAVPPEFPGMNDPWLHFKSPNFELYSQNREKESLELLHNLELFRAVFLESFKLVEKRRQEVTIYFFKSDRDFRWYVSGGYGKKHDYAGFYVAQPDRSVIFLRPGEEFAETRQLIFHEYGHHLFRVAEQNPPPWFDEGMAELFSTIEPKDGKMEFGHPITGRLWQLNAEKLMPLEELFAVDRQSPVLLQGDHTGLFYAESWALLHYLYFGDSKIPAEKRMTFVGMAMTNRFKDGADMRATFREVFGMDYPQMQARLEEYVSEGGRYYWGKKEMPRVPSAAVYAKRAVPAPEVRLRLAELALRVNRSPAAKLALLNAMEKTPDDPRPVEALGSEALQDGDLASLRERWGRAVELGTHNPAIYRELGLMESQRWFAQFDVYFRLPAEAAERLRGYLKRSIEYNPRQTDSYEMLAWVEAFAPEPSIPNVMLVQKQYPELTRRDRTALALAFVRVRLDRKQEALEMLADMEKLKPEPWVESCMEITRAYIEKRPVDPAKMHPGDVPAGGKPRAPAAKL